MAVFVLDSSVAAGWCFTDESSYTEGVLNAVSGLSEALAPRLWPYEIRNSVLMGLRRGRITQTDANAYLESLPDLRIRLTDPHSSDDVFGLAARYGLTAYDAAYLDVAIRQVLLIRCTRQNQDELLT